MLGPLHIGSAYMAISCINTYFVQLCIFHAETAIGIVSVQLCQAGLYGCSD